jgi:hypothetical protein
MGGNEKNGAGTLPEENGRCSFDLRDKKSTLCKKVKLWG